MMKEAYSLVIALLINSVAVASEAGGAPGAPGAHPGAGASPGANPFDGTIYQSIAAVVVFVLLMVVLRKYAWGPILKGLQDREQKIHQDLDRAEQAAKQAERTLQEYQAKLSHAQDEAKRIIEQGRDEAQKIAIRLKEQTQQEIDQLKQRCQNEIQEAKQQAVRDIYTVAAELSTAIAGRILQRQLNPEDNQRLIQESLAQMDQSDN